MSFVILGGNGYQGRAILHYLKTLDKTVITVDPSYEEDKTEGNVTYIKGAVDHSNFPGFINQHCKEGESIIISCLRPGDNINLAGIAVFYKMKGWIDLGGSDKHTDYIRGRLSGGDIETSVVLDCGLAPGLPSSLATRAKIQGKKVARIYCGGIPELPNSVPFEYLRSFSMEGLLGEYQGTARVVRGHKVMNLPTLFEREYIRSRGQAFEGTHTSGGLSFTCEVLKDSLFTLEYMTLRPAGHWDFLKSEILWRDPKDAIQVMNDIFLPVSKENPDKIILQIESEWGDKLEEWFWRYDHDNDISAMAQATGYTVGAVALLIEEDEVLRAPIGMHMISFDEIVERAQFLPNQFMKE